jgi:hypothetical protein
MKRKGIIGFSIAVIILVGMLYLFQLLLMPKYIGPVRDGALVSEYYDEAGSHDVIFIGDFEVYESFSPVTLWQEYGITSFIRGTPQQLIWQSYYLLEEALEYEKPDVVVFNVLSMHYDVPQNEAYNRMTLDGMRWSSSKSDAIKASMTNDESYASYIFPFLRFHSRWSELTGDDLKYMFGREKVSHNGYLMRVDEKPAAQLPTPEVLADYTFSDVCYNYLDCMRDLCRENGIELILIKAPSIYPHWYDEWDAQMAAYAEENGLTYINFLDLMDECGIDMQTDSYDGGLHLNVSGAEKLSVYFGHVLKDDFGLADHRGESALAAVWARKIQAYNAEKAAQHAELEQYGYLKSLRME